MYNWSLYDNWCQAAKLTGLELKSSTGGCIYMDNKLINHNFFWMLWTPLNTVDKLALDRDWPHKLNTLKDNSSDFHIEAALRYCDGEYHYEWFNDINTQTTPSTDVIVDAIHRMLDQKNWGKYNTSAALLI